MNLQKPSLDKNIAVHIFTASAGMVGVCLTVIGLLQIVIHPQKEETLADDLLAIDAILFLTSCLLAYWALRKQNFQRLHRIEELADTIFLLALVIMVFICAFIVYTLGNFQR
jgi:hypothetical protein